MALLLETKDRLLRQISTPGLNDAVKDLNTRFGNFQTYYFN